MSLPRRNLVTQLGEASRSNGFDDVIALDSNSGEIGDHDCHRNYSSDHDYGGKPREYIVGVR